MWSEAAQEIFVGCIAYLQATKGRSWGWRDLEAVVTADVDQLAAFARDHNPNGLRLLAQPDSKTTLSILTTFQTHMRIVSMLTDAWSNPSAARFSIRAWLHNPVPYRPLILQHDPGYPELSRIWIGSMLGLLASAVGSPTLRESRERRVWLFLDEFPQLPPIKQFPTFLELGRSKGIAVVIGAQDTAQIRAVYGQDQAKSWFGMTGTPGEIVGFVAFITVLQALLNHFGIKLTAMLTDASGFITGHNLVVYGGFSATTI